MTTVAWSEGRVDGVEVMVRVEANTKVLGGNCGYEKIKELHDPPSTIVQVRKWSDAVDPTSNLLVAVPGGNDG